MSLAHLLLSQALAVAPVNAGFFDHVAIDGYDPVAYFVDHRPVEGADAYTADWGGATWHFASAEHRDLFLKSPSAYAPQYGGYCAWAVAHNDTADIDPKAWKIVGGKLYLNYSLDIQKQWEQDVPGHIKLADGYWPGLKAK